MAIEDRRRFLWASTPWSRILTNLRLSASGDFNLWFLVCVCVWLFFDQNSGWADGVVGYLHWSCQCQKQAWTNMQVLYFFSTIPGFSGRFSTCSQYRNFWACSSLRTMISGFVFLPPILDILQERISLQTISIFSPAITAKKHRTKALWRAWNLYR